MKTISMIFIVSIGLLGIVFAQSITQTVMENKENVILQSNSVENPCITSEEYLTVAQRCSENIAALKINTISNIHGTTPTFQWPLRASDSLKDYSYYIITNYVDVDIAKGSMKDYTCGKTTYDGHNGTDITLWPFTMYKMDHNQVEVIAAAPGIIIDKKDGFYDKNCVSNNGGTNYVIVQHADGSRAYYWHLKKNSLTSKAIGQSVAVGEFLAIVGSSGSSSIPHLHFEVITNTFTVIDPYSGPCNSYNDSTWWAVQKPYTEPAIVKLSLNFAKPLFPACPATETLNEQQVFPISQFGEALFYSYTRSETLGLSAQYRIINPDGSTFNQWTTTSSTNFNATIRYWVKTLPTKPGTYLFEGTLNGITTTTSFQMIGATSVTTQSPISAMRVYPNPSHGSIIFDWGKENDDNNESTVEIYNILGAKVYQFRPTGTSTTVQLTLPTGIYFLRLKKENTTIPIGKFIHYSNL